MRREKSRVFLHTHLKRILSRAYKAGARSEREQGHHISNLLRKRNLESFLRKNNSKGIDQDT